MLWMLWNEMFVFKKKRVLMKIDFEYQVRVFKSIIFEIYSSSIYPQLIIHM